VYYNMNLLEQINKELSDYYYTSPINWDDLHFDVTKALSKFVDVDMDDSVPLDNGLIIYVNSRGQGRSTLSIGPVGREYEMLTSLNGSHKHIDAMKITRRTTVKDITGRFLSFVLSR